MFSSCRSSNPYRGSELEVFAGGPEGQGSVSDSCMHPMPCTAEWGIQRQSQGCAVSLRPHIPPYQMLIEDALVAWEIASFGETMLAAQLLWSS